MTEQLYVVTIVTEVVVLAESHEEAEWIALGAAPEYDAWLAKLGEVK